MKCTLAGCAGLFFTGVLLVLINPPARAAIPQIKLDLACDGQLFSPTVLTHAGDGSGRVFIAEQLGQIRLFKDGMLRPDAFLDLSPLLVPERPGYDERGLLGLAFHPGYASAASPGHRKFYVCYIAPSPNAPGTAAAPVDSRVVVAEYRVSAADPNVADPATARVLLAFDKPQFNNCGGDMAFGPDGLLYISTGDGGGSQDNDPGHTGGSAAKPATAKGNAQDLSSLHGKLLRIDPLGTNGQGGQYGIPATNPFAAGAGGERREIYAWGLRDVRHFSFDKRAGGTGRLFAGDAGQDAVEEVSIVTAGANCGWRNMEGITAPAYATGAPALTGTVVDPIGQYAHPGVAIGTPTLTRIGRAVTGGYVYRGPAFAALAGKYVFADRNRNTVDCIPPPSPNALGTLLGLEETSPGVWALTQLSVFGGTPPTGIQAFGEDESGELYVLTKRPQPVSALDPATGLPGGAIYKIVPVPASTALTLNSSATVTTKDNTIFNDFSIGVDGVTGELANGAGDYLFAGSTDPSRKPGAIRRALVSWGLNTLPAGSLVIAARITMKMDRTISGPFDFSLHRMMSNWGEGTSEPLVTSQGEGDGGIASATDATWVKPFHGQAGLWTNPGGDFAPAPSATSVVDRETTFANGIYTWSSPQLAKDVNAWLANPSANFGWLLKADIEAKVTTGTGAAGQNTVTVASVTGLMEGMEIAGTGISGGTRIAPCGINTTTRILTLSAANISAVSGNLVFASPSAKRFVTKTAVLASNRPRLILNYVPAPTTPTHRRAWELAGYLTGQYIDDNFDTDGDGIIDGVEYAWGFSPRATNNLSSGFSVNSSVGSPVVIIFRRDTLATDLTYRSQVSTDMTNWITLATSTAGGTPTGTGFVSESTVDTTFRNVTVHDTVPAGGKRRLYRLQITRQ